ncbi:hybrid sensor histidine kinase/response regulator transcription factor [Arcticibacter tournemirensis]
MTQKRIRFFFFVALFFLFAKAGSAQIGDLNFMNLGTREGLSSNIVSAILKDRYGYVWFATNDGLNKFDGTHFTIYRRNADDPTSIISSNILSLYEDGLGNLWVGTEAGLVLYNRKMDSFINYTPGPPLSVTSICSDASGMIWIAGYEGIRTVNPDTRKVSLFKAARGADQEVVSQVGLRLFRDSRKRVWLGTKTGLYLYIDSNNTFKRFSHSDNKPSSLADNSISAISEDNKGNIWVGTNNGLSMLKPDGHNFINYRNIAADKFSLSSSIVYAVAPEPNGKLWVGTEEGLNILDPADGKVLRVERSGRNKYGLTGKSVKAILIDKHGIYWVATFRGGVNKYDKNLAFFNLRQSNSYDPYGLSAPVVTSFAPGKGNTVYVGTDGGGLNLFDVSAGTFRHITLGQSPQGHRLSILAMESVSSEIWIGTFLKGLFIFDTKTGESRQVKKGAGSNAISSNEIFCIKKDSRGTVWIGTNGQGVDMFDPQEKRFQHFNKHKVGLRPGQFNGYVRAIEEDWNGNIWIGLNGSGIAVYNPVSGLSRILHQANSKLPNDNVTTICTAGNGTVWVGTAGGGLARFNAKTSSFSSYSEKNGLANGVIYKIIEDKWGKLWMSTNKGISSFDIKTERFKNYSYYNGLQRNPFVPGAGLKLPDGRLFFGGIDGFNYFDPQQLHANKNVPKVVLTDLKISNQSVLPSAKSEIKEHISVAREIHLDYKQNFSLSFVSLNFTSPEENRYLYKLDNFDKEWNRVGPVNTAVYTNLDPGEYVFQVKATTDAGEWTTPVTSIKIFVRPPFWLTYYAYACYILLIGLILAYMRYVGIQKLKARFAIEQERVKAQQQIEQERREAERLHEFDELRIKFLTNLSHEFRTPISLIVGPVEQLLQQETSNQKANQLNMIRRNARRLLNLVNQLLDFRNVEKKELSLNVTEGDFISFAKDVSESFRDLAERKQIHFGFRSSVRDFFTFFDHDKVERILFNLLSNAFKFTLKGGEVLLHIENAPNSGGIIIRLEDTGVGIQEREKMKIFERFFQSDTDSAVLNQGNGIGLSITREFVKIHGGTIEVESIEGKGSTFIIFLPLKRIEETFVLEEDSIVQVDDELESLSENIAGKETVSSALPVVLLIEDNEDFRFYLKDNLKSCYKIIEAANGKEGWQKVLFLHPQVVISDISMPYMNGIELCRKIKSDKRTCHIPVLLLTALTGEEDQLHGLETGADDYMTKPCNFDILDIKIRNLLALNERLKTAYSKQIKVLPPEVKMESDNEKLLSKVIRHIDDNLTNPQLSVENLSKHVGMSRGSLYTKMLELTGETPVEFIRSVKLDRAAVLLEKTDMNVGQVSYAVGFATPNYFARAFKSRFNLQPSEYISLKRSNDKNVSWTNQRNTQTD